MGLQQHDKLVQLQLCRLPLQRARRCLQPLLGRLHLQLRQRPAQAGQVLGPAAGQGVVLQQQLLLQPLRGRRQLQPRQRVQDAGGSLLLLPPAPPLLQLLHERAQPLLAGPMLQLPVRRDGHRQRLAAEAGQLRRGGGLPAQQLLWEWPQLQLRR
jgi:hypothetical protein